MHKGIKSNETSLLLNCDGESSVQGSSCHLICLSDECLFKTTIEHEQEGWCFRLSVVFHLLLLHTEALLSNFICVYGKIKKLGNNVLVPGSNIAKCFRHVYYAH